MVGGGARTVCSVGVLANSNDDSGRNFDLINNTDSLYSRAHPGSNPQGRGETEKTAGVGVVNVAGGPTRWLDILG